MSDSSAPGWASSWLQQHVEFDEAKTSGEFIREIHEQLQPALEDMKVQLEETKFRYVFLPWFAGDEDLQYFKTDRAGKAHDKAVAMWIGIAGSALASVDITDDKTGEILFTVPPLCDREALIPALKDRKSGSIMNMVMTMQSLRNVGPHLAKNFFDQEVSKRAASMFRPTNLLKFVQTWNDIFTRYGRPPLLELPDHTKPQSAEGKHNGTSAISQSDDDWELL